MRGSLPKPPGPRGRLIARTPSLMTSKTPRLRRMIATALPTGIHIAFISVPPLARSAFGSALGQVLSTLTASIGSAIWQPRGETELSDATARSAGEYCARGHAQGLRCEAAGSACCLSCRSPARHALTTRRSRSSAGSMGLFAEMQQLVGHVMPGLPAGGLVCKRF